MRTLATATTRAVCASERPPRGQQRSRPSKAGQLARPERGLGSSAAAAGAAAAAAAPALDPHDAGGAGTLPASTPHRSISVLNRFRALILDQSYRPVGVANWQRAVCLDLAEKADVLDYYDATVRATSAEFFLPAVMRVRCRGGHTPKLVGLNRANILLRDGYSCQYCGSGRDLTLDHVVPQSKGGVNSWQNLVACCASCNSKKGDKSLERLGWRLRKQPKEPSPHELDFLLAMLVGSTNADLLPPEWQAYIVPFRSRKQKQQHAS